MFDATDVFTGVISSIYMAVNLLVRKQLFFGVVIKFVHNKLVQYTTYKLEFFASACTTLKFKKYIDCSFKVFS